MAAMSDFLEQQIIDHLLRTATFAKPSAIYIGLYTSDPADDDSGTEVSTVDTGYAREEVVQLDANWTAPGTGGLTDNVNAITFPTPTGATNWGLVTHMTVHDAVTAGNLLLHGVLAASKNVNQGDPAPNFPIGDLDITFA